MRSMGLTVACPGESTDIIHQQAAVDYTTLVTSLNTPTNQLAFVTSRNPVTSSYDGTVTSSVTSSGDDAAMKVVNYQPVMLNEAKLQRRRT